MVYENLITEQPNEKSKNIDRMSALEIATLVNDEDKIVPIAVEKVLPQVAEAIDVIADAISNGGRLIYIGAGTSGRLGIVDAAECPPTYGVSKDTVQGIMIGGNDAVFAANEKAEDDPMFGEEALKNIGLCEKDICFGSSASGSAKSIIGALTYAKKVGAKTVAFSTNPGSPLTDCADISITPSVGSEVINGSTRMKSATAQKLVLTTVSTGVMVRLGRIKGKYLVYMRPSNIKLKNRAQRIICDCTGISMDEASELLGKANGDIKKALDIHNGLK